jgi:hypothetical protein
MALKAFGEGISDGYRLLDDSTEGCWDGSILRPFLEGAFEEYSSVG